MSAFGFCLISFTIISIIFHNKLLVNKTHKFRVTLVVNFLFKSFFYFISFLSIGFASFTVDISGFYLALFGSTIQGYKYKILKMKLNN